MSVTTVSDTGPTVSVELWSLRDSCQVPALGDQEGLTELRRRGLGFREAAVALFAGPSTGEAYVAHLAPENCKEVFESLATNCAHVWVGKRPTGKQ